MNDLQRVFTYINSFASFSLEDLAVLQGNYTHQQFAEDDIIFNEGEYYSHVTFILKGMVKKFYTTDDGKEFIKEFAWENQITTPYASLIQKVPATYSMQAIEATELLVINYDVIEKLFQTSPKWMALGKAFADMHFINREKREMEFLKYDASKRYELFKSSFPQLLKRLKKQDIAAYLGITPVSLSRLQKND
jgi:CRP-like cAMP-binding protein